jgi:hypothetical protein
MTTRVRRLIVAAFAALVAAAALGLTAQSAGAAGPCINGHNWDNIHQTCS